MVVGLHKTQRLELACRPDNLLNEIFSKSLILSTIVHIAIVTRKIPEDFVESDDLADRQGLPMTLLELIIKYLDDLGHVLYFVQTQGYRVSHDSLQ
jgi:hypothetical protein